MQRQPSQPQSSGRTLVATILSVILLSPPTTSLGINCRGSLYCMGMDVYNVTGQILDLATKLSPHAIYGSGAHIACIGVKDELSTHVGAFCLFMQGDNAHGIYEPITGFQATGIEGSLIKSKTLELYQHRCRACGSVPISNNNDPNEQGILTINYVRDNAGCAGRQLCDPTIKAGDKVHNPFNKDRDTTRGTSEVVNSTADGTQPCAQEPRDPVVTDLQGVPIEECNPLFGPSPNATVVNNEIARANVGANHEKNASTNAIAKANSPGLMANLTTLLVSTSMRRVAPTTVSTVVLLSSPAPLLISELLYRMRCLRVNSPDKYEEKDDGFLALEAQ